MMKTRNWSSWFVRAGGLISAALLLAMPVGGPARAEHLVKTFDEKAEELVIHLTVEAPAHAIEIRDGWSVLRLGDAGLEFLDQPDKPDLPFARRLLAIPGDAAVEQVRVRPRSLARHLDAPLMPRLRPWSFGETPPVPVADPAIYESARLYPEKRVAYRVVRQAGVPLLELDIFPFQYRGETRELIEHQHLEIEIRLRTATGQLTPHAPNAVARTLYPNLTGAPPPEAPPAAPERRKTSGVRSLTGGDPADYVLIAPSAWTNALGDYITAKNAEGIPTRAFALEDINAQYASGSTVTNMYLFIRDAFTNWNISYVLLVGHTDYVPTKFLSTNVLVPREYDNFFTLLDDSPDSYPDVFLGRLPAQSVEEVERISQQWADYDQTGWGRTEFDLLGYELEHRQAPSFRDYNWVHTEMRGTNVGYTITSNDVINALNSSPALVNWVGHGGVTGWQLQRGGHVYVFREYEAFALTNKTPRLPFINAIFSCHTAIFSVTTNIGNSFIRAPQGGAIGYVGANDEVKLTYHDQMNSHIYFYRSLLSQFRTDSAVHFAAAFHGVIQGNQTRLQLFNMLGDPTARMTLLPTTPDDTPPVVHNAWTDLATNFPLLQLDLRAIVTDNDCVGVAHLDITNTVGSNLIVELSFNGPTNATGYIPGAFLDVAGIYHGVIVARDISSNLSEGYPLSITIHPDNDPPVIESVTVTPPSVAQHASIRIEASVTDEADPYPVWWGVMQFPDSSIVTQEHVELTFFTNTVQTGRYDIVIHAQDISGNLAIPVTTNFWVLVDSTPPVIHDAWIAPSQNYGIDGIWRSSCVTNTGAWAYPYMLVSDDLSPAEGIITWAEIRLPDQEVITNDMSIFGFTTPTPFSSTFFSTAQTGSYRFVFYAQDGATNLSSRGPVWFFVTDGQLPPPVIHDSGSLGGGDLFIHCIAPSNARPYLTKRPSLMQGGWQTVMPEEYDYSFSNGVFRIEATPDASWTSSYYKVILMEQIP